MKNIIREIAPENAVFESYFDNDGFTSAGGDYNYNLFIITWDHGQMYGFNLEEYKNVVEHAENILSGFSDVDQGIVDYDGRKITYKQIMQDEGLKYSPVLCHKLRAWAEKAVTDDTSAIAKYLTITTGKYWAASSASGYCQGDWCEYVYCAETHVGTDARAAAEIWLGCAKEFCVINLDENGEEIDSVYGYIVADSQAWRDDDYKKLVCDWAGIDPAETRLEMIDGSTTRTVYSYRSC